MTAMPSAIAAAPALSAAPGHFIDPVVAPNATHFMSQHQVFPLNVIGITVFRCQR